MNGSLQFRLSVLTQRPLICARVPSSSIDDEERVCARVREEFKIMFGQTMVDFDQVPSLSSCGYYDSQVFWFDMSVCACVGVMGRR